MELAADLVDARGLHEEGAILEAEHVRDHSAVVGSPTARFFQYSPQLGKKHNYVICNVALVVCLKKRNATFFLKM